MPLVVVSAVVILGATAGHAQDLPSLTMRQLCDMRGGLVVDAATSMTVEIALVLMKRAKAPGTLLVCRVSSQGQPMPMLRMVVALEREKEHLLLISKEYEQMSMRGLEALLAHEVMHVAVPLTWSHAEQPTPQQYADFEADIDRRAVHLVGKEAFLAGLDELERVLLASLNKAKDDVRSDIKYRRRRLQE